MLSKEQNTISYYLYNCTIVGKSSYIREGIAKPQSKLLYNLCSTLSYFILVQKCSNSCHNFHITNQGRFRTLYRLIHCIYLLELQYLLKYIFKSGAFDEKFIIAFPKTIVRTQSYYLTFFLEMMNSLLYQMKLKSNNFSVSFC